MKYLAFLIHLLVGMAGMTIGVTNMIRSTDNPMAVAICFGIILWSVLFTWLAVKDLMSQIRESKQHY